MDLVPDHGIKLTPKHYAYLKISEGCNHRCTFCIIPSMRGDLDSRPIGDVLGEAQRLAKAGVKELLVISQDTSAYGVDVKHKTAFWDGMPVKTHMQQLCEELAKQDRNDTRHRNGNRGKQNTPRTWTKPRNNVGGLWLDALSQCSANTGC